MSRGGNTIYRQPSLLPGQHSCWSFRWRFIGLSLLRRTPVIQTFILNATENKEAGFQAPPSELASLVGKSGKTLTPLRPAGAALINGHRVDIVTQGEFVAPETDIEVIFVEGSRVVVRSLQ